ncbi:MAG: ATP-binding protein [Clostridia bacterium]|nr:ATP-binding protein [Clostridia bacterium]
MKYITSLVRRAVEDYDMISEGDRVAVGISGGKDSLALAAALLQLSHYYPKKFTPVGVTLDLTEEGDFSEIEAFMKEIGMEYHVKRTNIREVVFDIRKETNPCSLCSKLRRGALNDMAIELGCKRVALGHHNDDVLETFMLSLLYEGRINCFSPVTYLDRTDLYSIRPMIYVREGDIKGAAVRHNFPVKKSGCPADGVTKRTDMKEIIKDLEKGTFPGLKKRLFTAISNSGINGWNKDIAD